MFITICMTGLDQDMMQKNLTCRTLGEAQKNVFVFSVILVFANILLADEINRATPKTQSALLEAMQERQVTVGNSTFQLDLPFFVLATQNPIEQEGTYPLPEAQMDRFLMHVNIEYTPVEDEVRIVELVRAEENAAHRDDSGQPQEAPERIPQQAVFDARAEIARVTVSEVVERYMVDLVFATRYPERYTADLRRWIQVGASPRGALALDRCARARAWLEGRDHVLPDDVRDVAPDCLRHRLTLSYEASADGISAHAVVEQLLKQVAVA